MYSLYLWHAINLGVIHAPHSRVAGSDSSAVLSWFTHNLMKRKYLCMISYHHLLTICKDFLNKMNLLAGVFLSQETVIRTSISFLCKMNEKTREPVQSEVNRFVPSNQNSNNYYFYHPSSGIIIAYSKLLQDAMFHSGLFLGIIFKHRLKTAWTGSRRFFDQK